MVLMNRQQASNILDAYTALWVSEVNDEYDNVKETLRELILDAMSASERITLPYQLNQVGTKPLKVACADIFGHLKKEVD